MGNENIIEILRFEKPYLQEKFGVLSIGLFGSYAKGTEGPDSDIDVLVELKEPRYEFLAGIQIHLESRFGRHVDVVRKRKGLSGRFLKRIAGSIQYA
jgi:predicted nucleotidyltransferase